MELREYRKRLSWMTSNSGISAMSAIPGAHSRGLQGLQNNEFLFDFPKFGDLPGSHLFSGQGKKNDQSRPKETLPRAPGVLARDNLTSPTNSSSLHVGSTSTSGSTPSSRTPYNNLKSSTTLNQDTSNSDSPSSYSDSQHSQLLSSNGTSPEPSLNSPPDPKSNDSGVGSNCNVHGSTNGEESFCAKLGMACGNINNPIPAVRDQNTKINNTSSEPSAHVSSEDPGFDWLAQQNGGQFDPVLFGDWREPQDAVLSQDFGSFFNEAFPLPDLGSPLHNITEASQGQQPPKKDLIAQVDSKLEEEVVPGEDKSQMLSCTKIWYGSSYLKKSLSLSNDMKCCRDRLQSMEKFRNGEIDVDNLCSELRTKARCSEGGVVVNQRDVDDIMGRAK